MGLSSSHTGDIITISKGNNIHFEGHFQGQGIISTRGGNETANYTLIAVENIPPEGNLSFRGAATGELSFLNNLVSLRVRETLRAEIS